MYTTSTTEYEPIPVFRKLELRKHGPVYKFFNNALKNPYVLIAPAVIIALGTTIFAIGYCIYMSFMKWDMLTGVREFVGFDNYKFIFGNSQFLTSLKNTIIFMLETVFIGMIFKVLIGVFLFEGVLVFGQQIANSVLAGGGLSEVMRIMISNGIILYALTQSGGASRE